MAVQDNLLEARRLSSRSQSCISKVQNRMTLMIHPIHSELKKGVLQELDSLKKRYCKVLGGIVMAYENVQLISSRGWLFDTNPFNHIIVQAEFFVFTPEVGNVLEGVVKKKTLNHIGCLVHGMFNVSVPKPFDTSVDDWCGTCSEEGDTVKLTITYVSMANFLPYITAELDPECIKELVNSRTQKNAVDIDAVDGTQSQNRRTVFDDDSGISISELEESLGNTVSEAVEVEGTVNEEDSNKRVKDRKRKRQDKCLVASPEEDMAFVKKKKKRKSTDIVEEIIDGNTNEEFNDPKGYKAVKRENSENEEYSIKKDKSRKRKREDESLDASQEDTAFIKMKKMKINIKKENIDWNEEVNDNDRDSLKKSRNKNKEYSAVIEECQSINDCNAEEELRDCSPKTTKKRKKKHSMDHSSYENIVIKQEQCSDETEYLKENDFQVSLGSRTSEGTSEKSGRKNKKDIESLTNPWIEKFYQSNDIQNESPLSSKSTEVCAETPEKTTKSRSSSSRKLKNMNMTSQMEKRTLSPPQKLEMSSITTPKRKVKSPSKRKSGDAIGLMGDLFELPLPDLELDF